MPSSRNKCRPQGIRDYEGTADRLAAMSGYPQTCMDKRPVARHSLLKMTAKSGHKIPGFKKRYKQTEKKVLQSTKKRYEKSDTKTAKKTAQKNDTKKRYKQTGREETYMSKIDLNCDLGESFGAYTIGMDVDVIPLISSCNIACGYHASDPLVMRRTISLAKEAGIGIGAHPGYPDLMGFGRRNLNVSPEEAAAYVTYQLGALYAFAKSAGAQIRHVKPHGALYNMAGKDFSLALAIAKAVKAFDPSLILLGLSGSESIRAAQEIGLPYAREVFADRAYMPDGSLMPRNREGAVIHDENEAILRVIRMVKEHTATACDANDIEIVPDSICVHGNNIKALTFVTQIRSTLEAEGIQIAPLSEIIYS